MDETKEYIYVESQFKNDDIENALLLIACKMNCTFVRRRIGNRWELQLEDDE